MKNVSEYPSLTSLNNNNQIKEQNSSNNSLKSLTTETTNHLQNVHLPSSSSSSLQSSSLKASSSSSTIFSSSKTNLNNLKNWVTKASKEPFHEIKVDRAPLFLASHRNHLFCVDEKEMLTVFNIDTANKFELSNIYKIPLGNIRSIGANLNYFGLTYSSLDKKYLKNNKNLKLNGVVLYGRDQDVVSFKAEKLIDLNNGESFEYPVGITLSDSHVFVCDKSLKSIYKIDIKTSVLLSKITMTNGGEPYKLSINSSYLVVSDILNHHLNLYDVNSLNFVKSLDIDQAYRKNSGPFSVYITSDNIIFFKNYPDFQLMLADMNMSNTTMFSKIKYQIEDFSILECANQTVVVGCSDKKDGFRILCFSNV